MEFTERRRTAALTRANRSASPLWRFVRDQVRTLLMAIAVFMLVRAFFVEAFKIPSTSMEGTLLAGDFLLVNKLVYGAELPLVGTRTPRLREPQRGDVIVFQWPSDVSKNFVKRIVGVPGDTLEMRSGRLVVNGAGQREKYVHYVRVLDRIETDFHWQRQFLASVRGEYRPSRDTWGPLIVPGASYFVLGDNRQNSLDSRYWGFVPDSLIRGQPLMVYYSFNPNPPVERGFLARVRWSRMGALVQ